MISNSFKEKKPQQNQIQVMRILCFALLSSVLMLGFVLNATHKFIIDKELFGHLVNQPEYITMLILGVALIALRIPVSNTIFKNQLRTLNSQDETQLVQAYFVPFVLRIALAEGGATMGFAAAIAYGEATSYVILGASAAFAILREFPSLAKIQDRAKFLKLGQASRSRNSKS